ncbi:Tm-1-like ATP-binding domain-containing protein [Limnoglobus roseus]|uniref:Uncharacterized protein n=1 Tax=Limnoglobus roseus TaxID=2598579 RepID=A0A5C1A473_9BACT|nr:Tm-1-like ATP-binding domain-containing protein [Limnoglobus roseus]QEL13167.1 hypothetical protein PX52LOC_00020 [Limnoglobus roseus]
MPVLLVGTLDTKGTEVAFVRDRLAAAGVPTLVLDAGVIGDAAFAADVTREQVFRAAGTTWEAVKAAGDRGKAIALAAKGTAKLAADLFAAGKIDGVLGLGGSAGTTIATAAMRALPVGVPKVMVSTLASGDVRPYVGTRDVMMLYSVVDISGLNRISRLVLANAADAMAGMARGQGSGVRSQESGEKPVVAATMFGVTTPCVEAARVILEAAGYEVLVFHATGTGGRTMEGLIRDGLIAGVLDITTTELADNLVGGILPAGPDRLTAAGLRKVPQVISVGALDMVNFGPPETVPAKFEKRQFYQHNPTVTLMRTTPEEMDALGKEIAEKACAAGGPTRVLLPLRGVSAIDAAGQPFWNPDADAALFQSLRNWVYPTELLVEYDLHINDPAFAEAAARTLLELMRA